MRLADYIRDHHEDILREWESFARTLLPAAEGMTKADLRDHADAILTAIVRDMESLQSAAEQKAKSKGRGADGEEAPKGETRLGALGQVHALLRIESGFSLSQMVAEYRALRASVVRLAGEARTDPADALRFNEAIDEALAEAVDRFTRKTDEYRDQLIGIVSHDLRNPLGGILSGATALGRSEGLDDGSARIATRIQNSARRMVRIVEDLLDLTRMRLGSNLQLVRGPTDLGALCGLVIAELEGSHPTAVIRYTASGDLHGEWDSDRLAQVLSNLVGNALQHGDSEQPIEVSAHDEGEQIAIAVCNAGPPIPPDRLRDLFEPMVRHAHDPAARSTGLGLGLYIAKELVAAHGGDIAVSSTAEHGTTFTVHLPRRPAENVSPAPRPPQGR